MSGLTADEKKRLVDVVKRRVGVRSDHAGLVASYLLAMERSAYVRTVGGGPVPTSLNAERSALLIEVSRQLGRVIEDFEIQALFRVTSAQAKSMRTTLLATYTDDAEELTIAWSLRDATTLGRRRAKGFSGTAIEFADNDRLASFVEALRKAGTEVEVVHGENSSPWLAVVADSFPKELLPTRPRK